MLAQQSRDAWVNISFSFAIRIFCWTEFIIFQWKCEDFSIIWIVSFLFDPFDCILPSLLQIIGKFQSCYLPTKVCKTANKYTVKRKQTEKGKRSRKKWQTVYFLHFVFTWKPKDNFILGSKSKLCVIETIMRIFNSSASHTETNSSAVATLPTSIQNERRINERRE